MDPLSYLNDPVKDREDYSDFVDMPFKAFLTQAVQLADAFNSCTRHFQKKPARTSEFTKDSVHSMQELAPLILASLMSNLELLQRCLFACIIDLTCDIPNYDLEKLERSLRDKKYNIGIRSILGYRGAKAASGQIICSSLSGWHNPRRVNEYSRVFLGIDSFYSNDTCDKLVLLWQLRHCIVHTGGTITIPDSQKLEALKNYRGKAVVFRHQFVPAVVKDFHKILKATRDSYFPLVRARFSTAYQGSTKSRLDSLFSLDSPRSSWLK